MCVCVCPKLKYTFYVSLISLSPALTSHHDIDIYVQNDLSPLQGQELSVYDNARLSAVTHFLQI